MESVRQMLICLILAACSSTELAKDWKASVVKEIDALVTSCVVVPCSFTHPKENLPSSKLRGIWHQSTERNQRIYHEDSRIILDSFKGRTKLLGHLGQGNCSLEMIRLQDHDNGPFCFRIELVRTAADEPKVDKFSFVEDCVSLKMLPEPPKPTLTHPKTANVGRPYTITCSTTHTCPTHKPTFTWSIGSTDEVTEIHKEIHPGFWEVQSILTIIPEEKDDVRDVTCTVTFYGRKNSSNIFTLYVKRTKNYNYIVIPLAVGVGTAVIFGGLCIFIVKKYKKRIIELQSQDGNMWNRLSRLSRRFRSDGRQQSPVPPRRSSRDMVDLGQFLNSDADQKICKPRFPSPKSLPKSYNYTEVVADDDDYENSPGFNVYGNV